MAYYLTTVAKQLQLICAELQAGKTPSISEPEGPFDDTIEQEWYDNLVALRQHSSGTVTADSIVGLSDLIKRISLNAESFRYADFVDMQSAGLLKPGIWYILQDYELTHIIPGTNERYTAPAEELLLLATSRYTLSTEGYSITYPSDKVSYHLSNNNSRMPGCQKGYISRRYDTVQNNNLEIDFRNVRFRRWYTLYSKPNRFGDTGGYMAVNSTGNNYQDLPMFGRYDIVLNNTWSGFDERFRPSIFDNINFTSAYRVINTTVLGGSVINKVALDGWLRNSVLIASTLENVVMPWIYFSTMLRLLMLSSSITNRSAVEEGEALCTLISSNISNEIIQNRTYINSKSIAEPFTPITSNGVYPQFNDQNSLNLYLLNGASNNQSSSAS